MYCYLVSTDWDLSNFSILQRKWRHEALLYNLLLTNGALTYIKVSLEQTEGTIVSKTIVQYQDEEVQMYHLFDKIQG